MSLASLTLSLPWGGKWLEILKEIAPQISSVALLHNPQTDPQLKYYMEAVEAAAPSFGISAVRKPVRDTRESQLATAEIARYPRAEVVAGHCEYIHHSASRANYPIKQSAFCPFNLSVSLFCN